MTSLLRDKRMGLAKLLSDNSRYVDDLGIPNYRNFSNYVPLFAFYLVAEIKKLIVEI